MDRKTFFDDRNGRCAYPAFRQSWSADYDHPQDWFDYLFVTGAPSSGSCYSNPNLDRVVASADGAPLSQGLVDYKTAGTCSSTTRCSRRSCTESSSTCRIRTSPAWAGTRCTTFPGLRPESSNTEAVQCTRIWISFQR